MQWGSYHGLLQPVSRVHTTPLGNSRHLTGVAVYALLAALLVSGCADSPPPSLGTTYSSSEALAQAVLDALADGDLAGLDALAINGQEFRDVVWPELPSSRPERGLPVSYAWDDLHLKSSNALRRLVDRWGGRTYALLAVSYDGETTDYDTFRVHRETRLTVRDEAGNEIEVHFYGSTLVRDDEYKVFSYVID